jgi:hypothetical protein
MAGFGKALAAMDAAIMSSLNDGSCDYQGLHGEPLVYGIEVLIDHNLQRVGAEGLFRSDAVGITWKKRDLPAAVRGGIFEYCGRRYRVEDVIEDDGHMITAACMVTT